MNKIDKFHSEDWERSESDRNLITDIDFHQVTIEGDENLIMFSTKAINTRLFMSGHATT